MSRYKSNFEQKEYFDNISSHYSDDIKISVEYLERLKNASSPFIKGKVLDIGNGGIICFDYKKASSVTLVDIAIGLLRNPRAVENKKLKPVSKTQFKILQASVLDLPFPKNSFDVIILFNVAHHLSVASLKDTKKNINRAFKEISRVLKKDGFFLFADNSPAPMIKFFFDPAFEFSYWFLSKFKIPLPYFLSLKQINTLLKKNKFKTIGKEKIRLSEKVYQPFLIGFTPPGWLWDKILGNTLFVSQK